MTPTRTKKVVFVFQIVMSYEPHLQSLVDALRAATEADRAVAGEHEEQVPRERQTVLRREAPIEPGEEVRPVQPPRAARRVYGAHEPE